MKRALVTGGSGVIGAAIARRLAAMGMHVLVHGHHGKDRVEALVQELSRSGSAEALLFDISDRTHVEAILTTHLQQGPIQVVVHSAGIHDDAPMAGMNLSQWHEVIDVSLHGFFHVVQPLLLPMIMSRWGRIISLSSVSALLGNRGQANYAAAKAGLHGASKSLAREVAARGVTVNVVAPGIIESEMTRDIFDAKTIAELVPMKRAGSAEEVAALVAFLASAEAGYISGQVISINGAMA